MGNSPATGRGGEKKKTERGKTNFLGKLVAEKKWGVTDEKEGDAPGGIFCGGGGLTILRENRRVVPGKEVLHRKKGANNGS